MLALLHRQSRRVISILANLSYREVDRSANGFWRFSRYSQIPSLIVLKWKNQLREAALIRFTEPLASIDILSMVHFDILITIIWSEFSVKYFFNIPSRCPIIEQSSMGLLVSELSGVGGPLRLTERERDQVGDRFAHRLDCLFKGADGSKVDRRGLVVRAKITCRDHFVARAVREAL